MRHYFLIAFTTSLIALTSSASADDTNTLINEATSGLKKSLAAIKTMKATFVSKQSVPESSTATIETGDYFRQDNIERIHQENAEGSTLDRLSQSGIVKTLIRANEVTKTRKHQASVKPFQDSYSRSSVLYELLIHHDDASAKLCTYDDLLNLHKGSISATRVTDHGSDYIKITLEGSESAKPSTKLTFSHNIKHGYWIEKLEIRTDGKLTLETIIDDFYEVAPGNKFPTRATRKFYDENGKMYQQREFTLKNLVVNEPISKNQLSLPTPPAGTYLDDQVRGVQGVMGKSWEIIGKSEPSKIGSLPPKSESISGLTIGSQTHEESLSIWNLLLIVSGISTCFLMGIILYRRLKQNAV